MHGHAPSSTSPNRARRIPCVSPPMRTCGPICPGIASTMAGRSVRSRTCARSALGLADTGRPDFGDAVPIAAGEVPAFWACGVTPQVVLRESGCPWFASHEPGQMFVTDADEALAPLAWD